MDELCNGRAFSQNLEISRSGPYDLLEPHDRKEILEVILGLYNKLLGNGA
jgi:hypothetical protein